MGEIADRIRPCARASRRRRNDFANCVAAALDGDIFFLAIAFECNQ